MHNWIDAQRHHSRSSRGPFPGYPDWQRQIDTTRVLPLAHFGSGQAALIAGAILVYRPPPPVNMTIKALRIGKDKSNDDYFIYGKDKTYVKDAYFSETTRKNLIAISAPIQHPETKKVLGVLVARNPNHFTR